MCRDSVNMQTLNREFVILVECQKCDPITCQNLKQKSAHSKSKFRSNKGTDERLALEQSPTCL